MPTKLPSAGVRPPRRAFPARYPAALWALLREWENDYQHQLSTFQTPSDAHELRSFR